MSAVSIGTRLHGSVEHVITQGMNSPCGRVMSNVQLGPTGKRMCRTCIRVNANARKINDSRRKAERETRIMHPAYAEMADQEQVMSWTYRLNAAELQITQEKIQKINERCANRGIPGGLTVEFEKVVESEENELGLMIEKIYFETKITGISPKLPGWSFMATLDYDENAGLVVRNYPYVKGVVDRAILREGWCDHCQTNRYRKTTFVVRNDETGEQIQVGSACIKDFTGWTALPYTFEAMQKQMEEFGGFGSSPRDATVLSALAIAWACVTMYGYVRSNEPNSTKDMVLDVLYPPTKLSQDRRAELQRLRDHADTMYERATALREWILSDEFSGGSDYVSNVKNIIGAEFVSPRMMGFLVSAPQAHARFMEKTLVKEREKAAPSEWIGEIGERWELSLTLKTVSYIESFYGSTSLHTFTDAAGNSFKWFASSLDLGGHEGEVFHVTAGIKAHKDWKGHKETHLTRVKEIDNEVVPARMVKAAAIKAREELPLEMLTIDRNGVYFNADIQAYFRIRVQKGTAYAVKFTEDGWTYSPRSIHVLRETDRITAEQAAQFGHDHGACVYCGKGLTDDRSTRVGYGPDCAATHGLPWGE
jgi:Family of unknown function (DUF6011)